MNCFELETRELEIKKEMSDLLVQVRQANGIKSPFTVSRELGQSPATLRHIEQGISFPTKRTLKELMRLYLLTPIEKEKINKLKKEMLEVRRQLKELKRSKL